MTQKSNLISAGAQQAAVDRLANPEPHQTLNATRLWCDLLSSMPLCFNLFGPLASDMDLARRAVAAWFPDAPGLVTRVRLEWSPARLDPDFLGNRTAFDAAIELDLGGGRSGIIGIETKYHEHLEREAAPSAQRMERYKEVADKSAAFSSEHLDAIVGGPQQQIWQDHLLALAMLQHPSKQWAWARFVVVHPAANPSFDHGAREYADRLADHSTFDRMTLESLIDNPAGLPSDLAGDLRSRYLW